MVCSDSILVIWPIFFNGNVFLVFSFIAPNTKDLDVFLRKQESGFGFRVLGGDGPDQAVSTVT